MMEWDVGVSTWIIQDGNYEDFKAGQKAEFALEFYSDKFFLSDVKQKFAQKCGPARYKINGEVIYISSEEWVLDFGICAYRAETPPKGVALHSFVSAEIYLGIDYYVYFEFLYELPEMPPLIYSWNIDSILRKSPMESYKQQECLITKTDAWNEDSSHYVLHCTKLDKEPTHQMLIPK